MRELVSRIAIVLLLAGSWAAQAAGPASSLHGDTGFADWAVDASVPGPDLPPRGRSLFDHLVAEATSAGGRHRVPYPLTALIDRLRATLSEQEFLGGIRTAIIPMGRSLQRSAAAPEFFRFPRFVHVVTGEPATREHQPVMLLKDRLYIGYVEKTALLEVISYNEAAGRFEFQIVKDYRPGAQPRVLYARRAVCIACHQNHAPIFSGALWSESNANAAVAARVRAERSDLDMTPQANIDFPDDIDKATIRANSLIALQAVWRQGCSDPHAAALARRCRAAAFAAILRHGLSGEEPGSAGTVELADFFDVFIRRWRQLWPDGLRIAQPSLPDRAPVGGSVTAYGGTAGTTIPDLIAASHVPPDLDPLVARPARELWRLTGTQDAYNFIPAWTRFFTADDFRTLDQHLRRQTAAATGVTVFRSHCRLAAPAAGAPRISLQCAGDAVAADNVAAAGHINAKGSGRLDWLNFGAAGQISGVTLDGSAPQRQGNDWVLHTVARKSVASARLGDGRVLRSLELRWPADVTPQQGTRDAQLRITIEDDFAAVRTAIQRLLARRPALFDDGPLVRARLMPALFAALGMPTRAWCCADDAGLPPPEVEAPETSSAVVAMRPWQPLFRYCAACHFTAEPFPANFLAGDPGHVATNLRHCAPRMLARIGQWRLPEAERVKTPMPPAVALPSLGIHDRDWMSTEDFGRLQAYLETLVREQGRPSSLRDLLAGGYESLPPCLPALPGAPPH